MDTEKIKRDSWTYKIMSWIYPNESKMPNSRCGYGWVFILTCITSPIWAITTQITNINSLFLRLILGTLLWTIIGLVLITVTVIITSMGVYLFGDLSAISSDPSVVREIVGMAYAGFVMIGLVITYYTTQYFYLYNKYIEWKESRQYKLKKSKTSNPLWTKVCKPIEFVD